MTPLQTVYFIPSLGQEMSDFLLHTVPLRRRRKVACYLQHFDLWVRHTRFKSLSNSLLPLQAYVYFCLSHISLYPGPAEPDEPRNYYLPAHIDSLLVNRKLKGCGRLSNRQVASRIAAAMNWQEYRFRKNLDPLRSRMKTLYSQATYFVQRENIGEPSQLYSVDWLRLITETCQGMDHWVRDLAMLRVLQETGCTTFDLARTSRADLIRRRVDDWHLLFCDQKKNRLTKGTVTLLNRLLGRQFRLAGNQRKNMYLFCMGDTGVEVAMDGHDIDIILERRYRFVVMIISVGCEPVVDLYCDSADPFPEGFVSEQKLVRSLGDQATKVVNLQFSLDVDYENEHAPSPVTDAQYFYVDWDDAIRNVRMGLAAEQSDSTSGIPTALENANQRNRRVFFTEEDSDDIPGGGGG